MTEKDRIRTVSVVAVFLVHLVLSAWLFFHLMAGPMAPTGLPECEAWLSTLSFIVWLPTSLLVWLRVLPFGFFFLLILPVNTAVWAWAAGVLVRRLVREKPQDDKAPPQP